LHFQIQNKKNSEMNCPKCNREEHVKAGFVKDRQRYRCKSCGYHYSVEKKSDVKSKEIRRMALEMYLEDLPVREYPVSMVELDELHSYVMEKKTTVGHGLLLIDLENGLSLLSAATVQQPQDQSCGRK
jgi:transposase-like protein